MKKLLKCLLCIMPLVLFFSYWPVIGLGSSESMNFELSLPLVWLVLFDVVGLMTLIRERVLFAGLKVKWWWAWLLFPVWVSLSIVWSLNPVRGVLTAGILWLLCFAGYVMWALRKWWDASFRAVWWQWFLGSALFACAWCVVQCVLDLVGVSQDYSLMCDGCTYHMFGFPHPNGFAIEPQFMGNLLLAPAIAAAWLCIEKQTKRKLEREHSRDSHFHNGSGGLALVFQYQLLARDRCKNDNGSCSLCSRFLLVCFFILTATLFLAFSRGAIYAFIVGMLFMSGFVVFGASKRERGVLWKRVGVVWGLVVLSFVLVLNVQGLMAEVGPTSDTYYDGVAKVLNHLSLGIIDIKGGEAVQDGEEIGNTEGELREDEFVLVEKSVENSGEKVVENSEKEEPVFEGYVAESTDTRVRLSGAAVQVWSQNASNMLLGVGLGGAGFALYNKGLSPAPKEIVQNEYASLLLETGLIGVSLFVLTMLLVVRVVWESPMRVMLFALLVAYGISLMFFSGLPNALHIYLLPMLMLVL